MLKQPCKVESFDTHPGILCSGGAALASPNFTRTLLKPRKPITNKVVEICDIKGDLYVVPISFSSLHHTGIMIKTSTNEHYIIEYVRSGGVLRKIHPNISGSHMNDDGYIWEIERCDKMKSNEYDPERIKKIMDIITYEQSYDFFNHNCHDVKQKILNAMENNIIIH